MPTFDADILRALRDLKEVRIRTAQHPRSAVVIWIVVVDDEVFVRSFRGTKGRWYGDLAAGGPATLEFAGRRLAVKAIPANEPAAIDKASREYLRKYQSEVVPMPRRWCSPTSCQRPCGYRNEAGDEYHAGTLSDAALFIAGSAPRQWRRSCHRV